MRVATDSKFRDVRRRLMTAVFFLSDESKDPATLKTSGECQTGHQSLPTGHLTLLARPCGLIESS